jgi:hypothetical protein
MDRSWELLWYKDTGSGEMQIICDGGVVGKVTPGPGISVFSEDELAARDAKVVRITLEKASDMIRGVAADRYVGGLLTVADLIDPRRTDPR